MTYEQFIDEIRRLVAEGKGFLNKETSAGTRDFRQWQYETTSLTSRARQLGYSLPGEFGWHRAYRATWNGATPKNNHDEFIRELGDSIGELEFFVDHFDKFGARESKPLEAAESRPKALEAPERVTARWLIDNVSVKFWWSLAVGALTVFLIGVVTGQSAPAREAIAAIVSLIASPTAAVQKLGAPASAVPPKP